MRQIRSAARALVCAACLHYSLPTWADEISGDTIHPEDAAIGRPDESADDAIETAAAASTEPNEAKDAEPKDATDAHHSGLEAEHEQIVITGTPLEHDRDELALPVDRIDREELLGMLGATIGETLATRPGIATTGFSGGASRPVIRGQDAFRTEVTEDGLPTQDVSRESPDHAIPVNPLSVERFEVVRGPATLRYGGGASAGVVNAITNRVPNEMSDSPFSGQVFSLFDSVSDRRDVGVDVNGGVGPVTWHVDGLYRTADDYEIPTGGDQNGTDVDSWAVSGGMSYFVGESGRIGAAYSHFDSEYGIPEEDEDVFIDMNADRARFEGDWYEPLSGIREVRVRGSYTDYTHDEIVTGEGVGQTFDNEQFDGRLELLHKPLFGFLGAFGVTGRARDFEAKGEAAEFLAPSTTTSVAGYVFEERELLPDLVGEFGFRVEGTEVDGTPCGAAMAPCSGSVKLDRSFVPVSGSVGFVYTPREGFTFGLIGVAAQRAPDTAELFARGPHEATGTFEVGDPGLDEETSYTGELRVGFERPRYRMEAAGFFTHYDDYIFGQLTGRLVNEEGETGQADSELDELLFITRNANFYGTEIFGSVDLLDAFTGTFGLDAQFDYVRARFTSGSNRDVPRIPPIRWGMHLTFRSDWVRGRFGFLRTEEQNDVGQFLESTDSFTFLNFSLTLSLAPLFERVPVELTLQGNNMLDEKATNVVSFNANELLLPGRNVRGTINIRF